MRIARISIDRGLCIGSGQCILTAPGAFELDDEQKSTVIASADAQGPQGTDRTALDASVTDEMLHAAAAGCPVKAITLLDDDGVVIAP